MGQAITGKDCTCEAPSASPNPRWPDQCARCGFKINPAFTSNDQTMNAFLDRLSEGPPIETFDVFRRHCLERERAGRTIFGHRFHGRDNIEDGLEEAVDGSNYCAFDVLKAARANDHDDIDLALTAAWHFAKAYDSLLHLRAKRHGAP